MISTKVWISRCPTFSSGHGLKCGGDATAAANIQNDSRYRWVPPPTSVINRLDTEMMMSPSHARVGGDATSTTNYEDDDDGSETDAAVGIAKAVEEKIAMIYYDIIL